MQIGVIIAKLYLIDTKRFKHHSYDHNYSLIVDNHDENDSDDDEVQS